MDGRSVHRSVRSCRGGDKPMGKRRLRHALGQAARGYGVELRRDLGAVATPLGLPRRHGHRAKASERLPDDIAGVGRSPDDAIEQLERLLIPMDGPRVGLEALWTTNCGLAPHVGDTDLTMELRPQGCPFIPR